MAPRVGQAPPRVASCMLTFAVVLFVGARPVLGECTDSICAGNPCTISGTHVLDSGCILAFAGKTVTLAQNAVLSGGSFTMVARDVILKGKVNTPNSSVNFYVDNTFDMRLGSQINTASTNIGEWGEVDIRAGGAVTLRRIVADGGNYGGDIYVSGGSIAAKSILQAQGAGDGGFIWLEADSDITIENAVSASATGTEIGDGGEVDIYPGRDLRITGAGAVRANAVAGGRAGTLWVIVENAATINGSLAANGAGTDALGGWIEIDAATLTVGGDLSVNGGTGTDAQAGTIIADTRVGTIVTTSVASMSANVVGPGSAGEVSLSSAGDCTLAGSFTATAKGAGSRGGSITASTAQGKNLPVTGTLDVRSATAGNGAQDGSINLTACAVTVSGMLAADRNPNGQTAVMYSKSYRVTTSGRVRAGATGGNLAQCTCAAVDLVAMTCPPPATCAAAPTTQLGAIVAPAFTLQPLPVEPCTGCFDNVKDLNETDVDCGGNLCLACVAGKACKAASDCQSRVCTTNICQPARCNDTVKNGNESDVDCGGMCSGCDTGQICNRGTDCQSRVCRATKCQAATCNDNVKNGSESDVDCGGTCTHARLPGQRSELRGRMRGLPGGETL